MKTRNVLTDIDWDAFEKVVIVSPHLDDAALSCAGLLDQIHGRTRCVAVTVSCANPTTRDDDVSAGGSGRARRGFAAPRERRNEDLRAMGALQCGAIHLGFSDAIDRRSATSGELIYRAERLRWQQPSVEDSAHVEELFIVLKRVCGLMGKVLLLSPLAIGYHVDHLICAQVALRLMHRGANVLFYEDFPYVLGPVRLDGSKDSPEAAIARLGMEPSARLACTYDASRKEAVLREYATQLPKLFVSDEALRASLTSRQHRSKPAEFYWRIRPPERAASAESQPPRPGRNRP